MACCIIAAFLVAQAMAMLRRWGMFWGVVAVPDGMPFDTVYSKIGAWFARPQVRIAVAVIALVELGALASWIYVEHGTHIYQIVDQAMARTRGERVIYAGLCDPSGEDRTIRIVLADTASPFQSPTRSN